MIRKTRELCPEASPLPRPSLWTARVCCGDMYIHIFTHTHTQNNDNERVPVPLSRACANAFPPSLFSLSLSL